MKEKSKAAQRKEAPLSPAVKDKSRSVHSKDLEAPSPKQHQGPLRSLYDDVQGTLDVLSGP